MENIRIYVGSYSAYNDGILDGCWLTLPMDEGEMWKEIKEHCVKGAEEFGIFDTDCAYDFNINELDNINDVNELAEDLEEYDSDDLEVLEALICEGYARDIAEARDLFPDCINYGSITMEDLAEERATECGDLDGNSWLLCYIDWERVARDMSIDGTYFETSSGDLVELMY